MPCIRPCARVGFSLSCCTANRCGWLCAAVGNAGDIVPYAVDQEVAMKVNGHSLSGVPEEYVAVRQHLFRCLALIVSASVLHKPGSCDTIRVQRRIRMPPIYL
jgi:hypothetical protein